MHDWRKIIRERLNRVTMTRQRREALVTELANHLEDFHAELIASGVTKAEATAKCLEQLNDIQQVALAARRVHLLEDAMNQRSRTLWLPGLITLTLASVSLTVMQLFAFSRPRVYWVNGVNVEVGVLWLLSLVPCGALGAYLSRRAGGSRWNSLVVTLFPSLTMLGVFCVVLPIAIFIEHNTYVIHHLGPFGLALLAWTIVPGVPSLLGAMTVCRRKERGIGV
jgi:hypothetical protein